MKLDVIIGSTRPGRLTERVAKWTVAEAEQLPDTEVTVLDLIKFPMPFLNDAMSPRFNPNRQLGEVEQKWLSQIEAAEAYVFVTPEYNHSVPGVLKNAIDFIDWQAAKKPATIVAHGTVGGARAIMQLKDILSESRMAVTPSQVALIGRAGENLDENGNLSETLRAKNPGPQTALKNTLEELKWYSDALAAARTQSS